MDHVHHRRNIQIVIIHTIIGYCGRAESIAKICVCAFVNLVIFFSCFLFFFFSLALPRGTEPGYWSTFDNWPPAIEY
ncbi:hypothetical protein BDV41DRAFT_468185 [Aspergillus transmontanensis]|uniref:Uncharacterized protein n=1 Tax=Aspergillus transmontanensis TaxID=1034304 RepID=A0A5N6VLE3_9EURO|nr:hypothetical protein BDV41DRAFT_468185 [Aspergillus transmontanensis]